MKGPAHPQPRSTTGALSWNGHSNSVLAGEGGAGRKGDKTKIAPIPHSKPHWRGTTARAAVLQPAYFGSTRHWLAFCLLGRRAGLGPCCTCSDASPSLCRNCSWMPSSSGHVSNTFGVFLSQMKNLQSKQLGRAIWERVVASSQATEVLG